MLVLEVKDERSDESEAKRLYFDKWIAATNQNGQFGGWFSDGDGLVGEVRTALLGDVAFELKTRICFEKKSKGASNGDGMVRQAK